LPSARRRGGSSRRRASSTEAHALPDHMRRDVDHGADEADATAAFVLRHEAQEGRCMPHGVGRESYLKRPGV
jgi:hypothetical protein